VTSRERRRVLVIAPFPPGALPAHGGGNAIAQLVKSLAQRQRVALAYLRAKDETDPDPALAGCCDALFESRRPGLSVSSIRPLRRLPRLIPCVLRGDPLWVASRWSPAFATMVRDAARAWKPDIVQAEFGAMGIYLPAARATGARTVVTFHDPETTAARERAARSNGAEWLMWRTEAALWHVFDRRLLGSVDAAVAFTERDARILTALNRRANVTRVALGADVPRDPADAIGTSPPLLLFVGNFNHPPNVDAARYLLDDLYPILRRRHDDLSIALVGDHPPDWLPARADRHVRVTGFVPDLRPVMNDAAVFVAPLRQGGGMRLKVLDALAAGKATVGTPIAFEGTGVRHDQHALVADSTAGLCAAIELLLRDPGRRVQLGSAAREHVTQCLTWDRTAASYGELYDRLLSRPIAARQERGGLGATENGAQSRATRDH